MARHAIDLNKFQAVPTDADGWFTMLDIVSVYPGIPQRTIRDALSRLGNQVESIGAKKGKKYRLQHRERTDRIAEKSAASTWGNLLFSAEALRALGYINQPKASRPPVDYNPDLLMAYQPNETRYMTAASAHRLERIGKRAGLAGQAGTFVLKIYDQLLLDLSFHSSRMEGNTYSREQAERLIAAQEVAAGRTNQETTMILNHKDAIEYLVQRVHREELTIDLVKTLHALLSENLVSYGYAGAIRDTDVLIGDSAYIPMSGEGVGQHRLREQLTLIIKKANAITNVFESSLFLLLHVSYLQAFIDVNKRTARLACILPMIKNDYIPISFVGVDQQTYVSCLLSFYELGAWQPMAEYFSTSYEASCHQFSEAARQTGWDEFGAKYRYQRREMLAQLIQNGIPKAEAANYVRNYLPDSVLAADIDAFCQMIETATKSLNFAQLAGIGVSRQAFERWQCL